MWYMHGLREPAYRHCKDDHGMGSEQNDNTGMRTRAPRSGSTVRTVHGGEVPDSFLPSDDQLHDLQ
jgi:hypothetical protein